MTLQRFNHLVFAVLGSLALGLLLILLYVLFSEWRSRSRYSSYTPPVTHENAVEPEGDATVVEESVASGPRVDYCQPVRIERSGLVLLPIAGRSGGAGADPSVCGIGSERSPHNVIAVASDGGQRFVFERHLAIERLDQPDERCERGLGEVPCELLLWTVVDTDTNDDWTLTRDDGRALLATDLDGRNLRRLSPPGTDLVSFLRQKDRLLLLVRVDLDGDGRFGAADPSQAMEVPARALRVPLPPDLAAKDAAAKPLAVPLVEAELALAAQRTIG